jgi:hypothetical protein
MAERDDPQEGQEGFERLTESIVRSILSSEEVMSQIRALQLGDALDPSDILALALRFPGHRGAEVRVELLRGDRQGESEKEESRGPSGSNFGRKKNVSSRKLTQNEELFKKYLQDRFDEEAWMKKAGIRFEVSLEEESEKEEKIIEE